MLNHKVAITGIGLISSAGNCLAAHCNIFEKNEALGLTKHGPYPIHSLVDIGWEKQICKKSDLRQLSNWQKFGIYAAGEALDDANLKDSAYLNYTDIVIAASGGERDLIADSAIKKAIKMAQDKDEDASILNEALKQELRPTLFLTQLANLLAGNIAIIHKTLGRSITLLGEDAAGAKAIEQAKLLIETGQSKLILVGASFFSEHLDILQTYEFGDLLEKTNWRPIKDRLSTSPSLVLGNGAAFLIVEELKHAQARGAKIYAILEDIIVEMFDRADTKYMQNLRAFWHKTAKNTALSCLSGERKSTALEIAALAGLETCYQSFSDKIGYMKEAQFLFGMAFAIRSSPRPQDIYTTMVGINNSEVIAHLKNL